jgi:glycosyltransferase involved in cell wall biosynthesis
MSPRVVVAMPLFEPGPALGDALEGLLAQTYEDYALVLVDDGADERARRVGQRHPRVTYRRNPQRLGLAGNWAAAFAAARELHPNAELFAWAGHHDRHEPGWLATLVDCLDAEPRAVLAYPLDSRLRADGSPSPHAAAPFATTGAEDPVARLRATARGMTAGSMVYGLMRAAALERAGVFDRVTRPDRLILAKLAVLGGFAQVPQLLWHRRITGRPTARRQRAATFPGRVPPSAYLSWPLVHGAVLARWLARDGALPRRRIPAAVVAYAGPLLRRDVPQFVLERLFALEGRLPAGSTDPLRRALGLGPRAEPLHD